MKSIKYPSKPWRDGQRATLIPGMEFVYSSSVRNWVPVSEGFTDQVQLEQAFGVKTVAEINTKFAEVDAVISKLDSDITLSGRIWKTTGRPTSPNANDIWVDATSGKTFSYDKINDTWIEN